MNELYKTVADKWMNVISEEYNDIRDGFKLALQKECMTFDEDIFHSTIISCRDAIIRTGLADLTRQGMKNYLFRSFKQNIIRETQYSRVKKRDNSITDEDIFNHLDTIDADEELREKVRRQTFNDWSVIQILEMVEEEFEPITFYCFRLKWLIRGMTYNRLKDLTKIKDCKRRCNDVMHWLRDNVDKDVLLTVFNREYV